MTGKPGGFCRLVPIFAQKAEKQGGSLLTNEKNVLS